MPVQSKAADLVPLLKEASRKAAACREAGNTACYQEWKKRLEALQRLHLGFGDTEDLLELEKARRASGLFTALGKIGGGIGTTALLALGVIAFIALRPGGRGRRRW